jgi:hypothetical protein
VLEQYGITSLDGCKRIYLIANGILDGSKGSLHARLFSDFQAQQIHIHAQKDILGADFNPLHIMPGRDDEGRFAFTKNVDVPKNYLSQAYLQFCTRTTSPSRLLDA